MKLNIYGSSEETIEKLADYFLAISQSSIAKNGRFSVALSGGSSPKKLYELLASENYKSKIEWNKTFFFFGDERYLPHTHKDSNFNMAKQALFEPLNIAGENIFAVNTSLPPGEAAKQYEIVLKNFFKQNEIIFNLVLLGLGDNSHIASLFPHTSVLHDKIPGVKALFIEEINAERITLNAPIFNQADHIAFLVFGKEKAEAVYHILKDKHDIEEYPAQLIEPVNGYIEWFLDTDAGAMIM